MCCLRGIFRRRRPDFRRDYGPPPKRSRQDFGRDRGNHKIQATKLLPPPTHTHTKGGELKQNQYSKK